MSRALMVSLLLALLPVSAVAAGLANENLLVGQPPGYKTAFEAHDKNSAMTEMVPANETLDNWTEMLTVQIYYGLKATPEDFEKRLEKGWRASCPAASGQPVASAVEHGYPVLVWLLSCPRNPQTHKPEVTWFKAIRGNDSFYLVQEAFRFAPSKQQIAHWMGYLKAVMVCDSRLPDRACPHSKK